MECESYMECSKFLELLEKKTCASFELIFISVKYFFFINKRNIIISTLIFYDSKADSS